MTFKPTRVLNLLPMHRPWMYQQLRSVVQDARNKTETMHNCTRYLIFFQYIGTKYRGAAKIPPHHRPNTGVQNHLEDAVRYLKPLNPVSVYISSRTDSGVHALSNTAHFDLQRDTDKLPFTEDNLLKALNSYLRPEPIRITHAYRVPPNFCSRFSAQSRTYVYRIALGVSYLPITEDKLCWRLGDTELDIEAMRKAAALLQGTHDFSSFRAFNQNGLSKSPIKTLDLASIKPGNAFVPAHLDSNIQLWEIIFQSKSFLYKQVRKMAGALVAVGQRKLSVPQFKELLEARDINACNRIVTAPAYGLFLTRVDYRDTDLQSSDEEVSRQLPPSGSPEDTGRNT